MDLQRDRRLLLLVCCFVLLTRAGLVFTFGGDQRYLALDSPGYLSPARALVQTGEFLQEPGGNPETYRTPGYPLWLALVFSLFGDSIRIAVLSQIALFIGTLVLLWRLTGALFGNRAALIATVLLAIDPPSFSYNFKILTETLSAFLILLFSCSLVVYIQSKGRGLSPLWVGLALTAATFVRPATYYFLPVLAVAMAGFHLRNQESFKSVTTKIGLMVLPFVLLVGGWQIRNDAVAGTPQFTTIQGEVLLLSKGAHIISIKEGISEPLAIENLRRQLIDGNPELNNMNPVERNAWLRGQAMKIIVEHPGLSVKTHFLRMANFFLEPGTTSSFFRLFDPDFKIKPFNWSEKRDYFSGILREHPAFFTAFVFGFAYLGLIYFFVLFGIFHFCRNANRDSLFWIHIAFFLLLAYFANLYAIGSGYSRYRVAIMPILCLYASAGFVLFCNGWRQRAAGKNPDSPD